VLDSQVRLFATMTVRSPSLPVTLDIDGDCDAPTTNPLHCHLDAGVGAVSNPLILGNKSIDIWAGAYPSTGSPRNSVAAGIGFTPPRTAVAATGAGAVSGAVVGVAAGTCLTAPKTAVAAADAGAVSGAVGTGTGSKSNTAAHASRSIQAGAS